MPALCRAPELKELLVWGCQGKKRVWGTSLKGAAKLHMSAWTSLIGWFLLSSFSRYGVHNNNLEKTQSEDSIKINLFCMNGVLRDAPLAISKPGLESIPFLTKTVTKQWILAYKSRICFKTTQVKSHRIKTEMSITFGPQIFFITIDAWNWSWMKRCSLKI